eukprot:TRINITY_DN4388_c0_g1_i1.p1 TRINITY_DN4388_c0_g1~~TRINITY_DN4388_c0_g1_i1.p1  ORF type:complete len:280 (-),score=47.66 TRINITY_DN4388_c0_g1_i1:20-859(-)
MDTDLMIVLTCLEWMMRRIDDNSYEKHRMCYVVKVADMTNLGRETLPIFVPEIRKFAQTNASAIFSLYPEHDILILVLNAPFVTRILLAFGSALMSKRQASRVKVFSDAKAAEPQALMKHLLPPSLWPQSVGGSRTKVELAFPLPHTDEKRVAEFIARKEVTIVRGVSIDIGAFKKSAPAPPTAEEVERPPGSTEKPPVSGAGEKPPEAEPAAQVEHKSAGEVQKAPESDPAAEAGAAAASAGPSASPVHEATQVKMEEAEEAQQVPTGSSWFCCAVSA